MFLNLFRRTYIAEKCGHKTKLKGKVTAFGETVITRIKLLEKERRPKYCHKCLSSMAIQCGWCGKPIFIGDPITLYIPALVAKIHPHAKIYKTPSGKIAVVGCLRWECTDTGADRAGFWVPPGKVHRVQTAYEAILGQGGDAIVSCNSVKDPNAKWEKM